MSSIEEQEREDEQIKKTRKMEELDLIYSGYQKALKAVKVNGTSMVVIDTLTNLVTNARREKYAFGKR